MRDILVEFIRREALSPFNNKNKLQSNMNSLFKTNDARAIHMRTLQKLSSAFQFQNTSSIWQSFAVTDKQEEITRRRNFFSGLRQTLSCEVLSSCELSKNLWHPLYSLIVATENEEVFIRLKQDSCPVQLILNENDIYNLESYDLVQIIECEKFKHTLERMPQSIFISSLDELYLERYLVLLSKWQKIILLLKDKDLSSQLREAIDTISPLIALLEPSGGKTLTREHAQEIIDLMNESLACELKGITIGGDTLVNLLARENLPKELQSIVNKVIRGGQLPQQIIKPMIPLRLDEEELAAVIRRQESKQSTSIATAIVKSAKILRAVPNYIQLISEELLLADFTQGIIQVLPKTVENITIGSNLSIKEAHNILLESPQPINFYLDENIRCSILTGANSGGKTTLLEHLLQLVSLSQLGIPVSGKITIPLFSSVYYFAKNKGSQSKGAFETLLTQLASVKSEKATLILADEIESVTEPGVAGLIICATAQYFLEKGCFLIVATHLGQEVQHRLPVGARIDGIEARGLTEKFELIVDHNPVLGRLAHSTPELIIEKLAKTREEKYFGFVHEMLKNGKK